MKLKLNDQIVHLGKNAAVQLEFVNMIFEREFVLSDYSQNLEVPIAGNEAAFSNAQLLHSETHLQKFSFEYEYGGGLIFRGTAYLNGITTENYLLQLVFGLSGLTVMKKKLSELDLGGVRSIVNSVSDQAAVLAHANSLVGQQFPAIEYAFPPVVSENFYGGKNPTWANFINKHSSVLGYLDNYISNGIVNRNSLVPMPFLWYVLKQALKEDGYQIEGSFYDDAEISQLMIYSNRSIDKNDFNFGWKVVRDTPIYNAAQLLSFNIEEYDPQNNFNLSQNKFTITAEGTYTIQFYAEVEQQQVKPDVHFVMLDINSSIIIDEAMTIVDDLSNGNGGYFQRYSHTITFVADASMVGSTAWWQRSTGNPYVSAIIYQSYAVCNIVLANQGAGVLNTFATNLDLVHHVPDITVGQLITALKEKWNLKIKPDVYKNTLRFDWVEERNNNAYGGAPKDYSNRFLLKNPPVEKSEHAIKSFSIENVDDDFYDSEFKFLPGYEVGHYESIDAAPVNTPGEGYWFYSNAENIYYLAVLDSVSGTISWKAKQPRVETEIVDANGHVDVKTECGVISMMVYDDTTPVGTSVGKRLYPYLIQQGSSSMFEMGDNPTSLKLLFWRNATDFNMPQGSAYATSGNRDQAGNIVAGRSLYPVAIIADHWPLTIKHLSKNELLIQQMEMTLPDVINPEIEVRGRWRYTEFFIRSMTLSLKNDKISTAEVKILLLNG